MFFLTVVFLTVSTLFGSTNRPIYTIKDGNTHRSSGSNQDRCSQSSYYQQGNAAIVKEDRKCNDCNRNNNRR